MLGTDLDGDIGVRMPGMESAEGDRLEPEPIESKVAKAKKEN